ncbi:hypothetical protein EJV47_04680 [Hymenobacter gummosus]|uniref:Preprotein translocase subunit SecB n=1 Tax=Hymenobacter gummosus TaxID=1776032 RepID=A0A431U790_9BACT|nr:hypothetical protein [Hymenobacter gummosus]RTQ52322.1 hypothetical protein EJV47_04680 [Hymenobacter gummosus]
MPTPDLDRIHLAAAAFLECSISPSDGSGRDVRRFTIPDETWLYPQFSVEEKRISYVVHVHCQGLCIDGKPTGTEGRFQVYFDFEVDNLSEHVLTTEGYDGPFPTRELMVMLGGVAYSTARGMIMTKVLDTPLNGFALPLRGPSELFQASMKRLQDPELANGASVGKKKPASKTRRKK